jgi:hypothetical protein
MAKKKAETRVWRVDLIAKTRRCLGEVVAPTKEDALQAAITEFRVPKGFQFKLAVSAKDR